MIDELTKEEFASNSANQLEKDATNICSLPCIENNYYKNRSGELEYALDMLEQGDSTGRGEGSIEAHNLVFVDEPVPDAQEVDKSVAQFDEPYQLHTDYP